MFQKKKSVMVAYTTSHCDSCGSYDKKRFTVGDYMYKTSECAKCDGTVIIQGIFGEML